MRLRLSARGRDGLDFADVGDNSGEHSDALVKLDDIGSELILSGQRQSRRSRQSIERQAVKRIDPVRSDGLRAAQQDRLVDQIGVQERRRNPRPAFDQKPGDAFVGQQPERGGKVDTVRIRLAARMISTPASRKRVSFSRGASAAATIQTGISRAVAARRELDRKAKVTVEHHTDRRSLLHARQAAGQQRIVRQSRADADQDRIMHRAHQMHMRIRRLARDRDRLAPGEPDFAVGRNRKLERDMRTMIANAADMPVMVVRALPSPSARYRRRCRRRAAARDLAPRLPDWDPRSPTRRARCRPR